jgi:hypothetical protein
MSATTQVHHSQLTIDSVLHVVRRLLPSAQPCVERRALSEGLWTPLTTHTDRWGGTMRHLMTAVTGLALAIALVAASQTTVEAGGKGKAHPTILPPHSRPYGKTYPEWVAAFWTWIFGDTGGVGTAVGDGYYLMLAPMSKGTHTIHDGGTFHFEAGEIGNDQPFDVPKDITIIVHVQ